MTSRPTQVDWTDSEARQRVEEFVLMFTLVLLPFHQHVTVASSRVNLSFGDPLVVLVLVVFVPTSQFLRLPDLSRNVLLFLISVIVGTLTLSVLAPIHFDSVEALMNLGKLSGSVAWFIAFAFLLMRDPRRRVRIAAVTIVVVSALIAIFSVFALLQGVSRVSGPFGNPNLYADYLLLSFYSCIYLYEQSNHKTETTIAALGFLGLLFISLIGTQSRAGLGAFIISFGFYGMLKLRKRGWTLKLRDGLLASTSAILVITAILFSGIDVDRYVGLLQSNVKTGGRLLTWRALWEAFLQSPIVGIGLGQTENVVGIGGGPSTPHNTYVRFLGETGLIGFVTFGGVLTDIIKSGFKGAFGTDVNFAPVFAYLSSSFLLGFFHGIINFRSLWVGIGIFTTLYYIGANHGE